MKTMPWLLLAVGVSVLFAAGRFTSARGSDLPLRSCANDNTRFSHNIAAKRFGFCYLNGISFPPPGEIYSLSDGDMATPLLRELDPQPDNDDRAGGGSDNYNDADLASRTLCIGPAEWRLNQPDTLHVNSFVNSKTKPKPQKQQTKP